MGIQIIQHSMDTVTSGSHSGRPSVSIANTPETIHFEEQYSGLYSLQERCTAQALEMLVRFENYKNKNVISSND